MKSKLISATLLWDPQAWWQNKVMRAFCKVDWVGASFSLVGMIDLEKNSLWGYQLAALVTFLCGTCIAGGIGVYTGRDVNFICTAARYRLEPIDGKLQAIITSTGILNFHTWYFLSVWIQTPPYCGSLSSIRNVYRASPHLLMTTSLCSFTTMGDS